MQITGDNEKLLQQLKSGCKRATNWYKYQPKVTTQVPHPYLDFFIEPSFQGVNRPFVLNFENKDDRTVHTKYYLPIIEIKDYIVMIDGRSFSDQPVRNNLITCDNIRKISTGQGDYYAPGCLLDYNFFNNQYKTIVIDLSKQQVLDVDQKAIQQIDFTENLNRDEYINNNKIMICIIEELKETILGFSQGTVKVL